MRFAHPLFQRVVEGAKRGSHTVAFGFHRAPFLDVEQHARKGQGSPVRRLFDASVGLDPVISTIGTPHAILMGVGAAALEGFGDRDRETILIVGMDCLDNLGKAEPDPPKSWIKAEGVCEGLVHGKAIGDHIPDPRADDGAGCEGEFEALVANGAFSLGDDPVGGLRGDAQHSRNLAVVVEGRRIGERPIALLRLSAAGKIEPHVDDPGLASGERLVDQRRDVVPDRRPQLTKRHAKRALGAITEDWLIRVVVK